jgi:glutamine synthetase
MNRSHPSEELALRNGRMMSVAALIDLVNDGRIDTVIAAFTDMQGRLQGKRLHAQYFVEHALTAPMEGCHYLLAVDVEMNTVAGYADSSWDTGYGDMRFDLDMATLRLMPHLPGTAMVQADVTWHDGTAVAYSPRAMLSQQLSRASSLGYQALAGVELEFMVFHETYEQAADLGYRNLTPVNQYNSDYSILATTRVEPLLRDIRNAAYAAGMNVESAKGECNPGQHEIGFLYDEALVSADNTVVYKNMAKEIAAHHGHSLTFMPKFNAREGNSSHIHLSLRGIDDAIVFWDAAAGTRSALYDHFIAGVLATMREFALLYAPNINSYKRFSNRSFAPITIGWGEDNRTCAVRIIGQGRSARLENRVPGGDANTYLALSAMLAGGLHGIEAELELPAPQTGSAYGSDAPTVPLSLSEARDAFARSELAHELLGADVVNHYTNMADVEIDAFSRAVTDWELQRSFERM